MSHQKSKGEKSPAISQTTPSEADDSVFDVADETVKSPSQAVDSKPTASDIQNDRSKQESDSTTGASDKKRKREESDTEGPAAKKTAPEHLIYVPPQYLTFDVMKECTRLAPPYIPSGKAATSKVIFDYAKFAELVPECPPIIPRKSKVLATLYPWLESSFGYSPYLGDDGKVSNNLRYQFDDPVFPDEVRKFKGEFTPQEIESGVKPYGLKVWDRVMAQLVWEKRSSLEDKLPVFKKMGQKGKDLTLDDVLGRWKPSIRESQQSGVFSDYLQFRLTTQTANARKGIPADPYTAFLRVWDIDGNLKNKSQQLTHKNSTDFDGEDADIIFDKGDFGTGIFMFDHVNYQPEALGATYSTEDVKVATRDELKPMSGQDEGQEEDSVPMCPL